MPRSVHPLRRSGDDIHELLGMLDLLSFPFYDRPSPGFQHPYRLLKCKMKHIIRLRNRSGTVSQDRSPPLHIIDQVLISTVPQSAMISQMDHRNQAIIVHYDLLASRSDPPGQPSFASMSTTMQALQTPMPTPSTVESIPFSTVSPLAAHSYSPISASGEGITTPTRSVIPFSKDDTATHYSALDPQNLRGTAFVGPARTPSVIPPVPQGDFNASYLSSFGPEVWNRFDPKIFTPQESWESGTVANAAFSTSTPLAPAHTIRTPLSGPIVPTPLLHPGSSPVDLFSPSLTNANHLDFASQDASLSIMDVPGDLYCVELNPMAPIRNMQQTPPAPPFMVPTEVTHPHLATPASNQSIFLQPQPSMSIDISHPRNQIPRSHNWAPTYNPLREQFVDPSPKVEIRRRASDSESYEEMTTSLMDNPLPRYKVQAYYHIPSETPVSYGALAAQTLEASNQRQRSNVSSTERRIVYNYLESQDWVRSDKPEPPIDETEGLLYELAKQKQISSRFDILYEPNRLHRCLWYIDGKRCIHETPRKDLARDHARKHLDYSPIKCDGICGKPRWYVNLNNSICQLY